MTIAIGATFAGGVVVCADTKVVATDGATHRGTKVVFALSKKKMAYAIANAAEDGNAANMLTVELSHAALSSENVGDLPNKVKACMTKWYSGFGNIKPPNIHFLVSYGGQGESGLFFCEPPNTVLFVSRAMAIGQGARPIDPFINSAFPETREFGVKPTLLTLAYLMHVAKSEEGSACGGDTMTVVVSETGAFAFVDNDDANKAEEWASRVDSYLGAVRNGLLDPFMQKDQKGKIKEFAKYYSKLVHEAEGLSFPTLDLLDIDWWNRKKS